MPIAVTVAGGTFKDNPDMKDSEKLKRLHMVDNSYDRRHPLFVGDWERKLAWRDSEFAREDLDDPHPKRKQTILDNHPQVRYLCGILGWKSDWIIIFMVGVQLVCAYGFGRVWDASWLTLILSAYAIGGSMIHIAGVILHETCHCAVGSTVLSNKIWTLIANIPIPVPIGISFRRYHLEHHTFQGVEGKDPDLPLAIEIPLIRGATWKKFLWMSLYPLMYVVRGAAFGKTPSDWEIINWITQLSADYILYQVCGFKGMMYLFLSLWLGYSFHPVAAHFIQEHYTFTDGQETYSYYGWANWFFMNIGYHNEHHDFPAIPWHLLPFVKASAPESYDTLGYHSSWIGVLWNFITDKNLGPVSRVVRSPQDQREARKIFAKANKAI